MEEERKKRMNQRRRRRRRRRRSIQSLTETVSSVCNFCLCDGTYDCLSWSIPQVQFARCFERGVPKEQLLFVLLTVSFSFFSLSRLFFFLL